MTLGDIPSNLSRQALRREARERRRELDLPGLSGAVTEQIAALPEFQTARHVLLYLASEHEINVETLAGRFSDKMWYAPRCVEGGGLALHPFRPDETPLIRGAFGLREPDAAHVPIIAPDVLDLVLVPGLLFTPTGDRLGQGGGYYDRFLPQLRADCLTVGIGCEKSLAADLPRESWDRRVDLVVTEKNIYDARPK